MTDIADRPLVLVSLQIPEDVHVGLLEQEEGGLVVMELERRVGVQRCQRFVQLSDERVVVPVSGGEVRNYRGGAMGEVRWGKVCSLLNCYLYSHRKTEYPHEYI